jgi:hypothetical protein
LDAVYKTIADERVLYDNCGDWPVMMESSEEKQEREPEFDLLRDSMAQLIAFDPRTGATRPLPEFQK